MRMRAVLKFAFCILHFAFCSSPVWAVRPYTPVHPDPVLESWRWRSFPELNGLGLRCMAEAKDKAMWFGVDDGVWRYDGVKWTAYTEKDGVYGSPVGALCATRDGSVYAGTEMGISRFKEGKWSRVFPPEGDLPWLINNLMEARDGSVWTGTPFGALRLSQEGPMLYTTEDAGAALRTFSPGLRLFIVPDAAAPARPRPEGIGVSVTGEYWGGGKAPKVIYALAPGGPGEVAGLKAGDHILAVNGQPSVGSVLWILQGPSGTSVRLTIQRKGRPDSFEVTIPRKKVEGTSRSFRVYDVYEDRQGVIWFVGWFGLGSGEIVRYNPSSALLSQGSQWQLYTGKDGVEIGGWPRMIQTRDGSIWTTSEGAGGTVGSISRFDGKTWMRLQSGKNYSSILETRDGMLWIGGFELCAFRDGTWRVYLPSEVSIPSHRTRLFEASDGALWLAGLGQEAVRLDYGTTRWTTYTGLNFQCETPDGAQWFVSQDSSVVRYDPSLRSGQAWTRYGVEDGLMDAPVTLLATRKGELWAAGSHDSMAATARFDPSTTGSASLRLPLRTGGTRWFLQTHPQLSWRVNSVYESLDGSLYFGAAIDLKRGQLGGVLRFDGKTLRQGSELALSETKGQAWIHYTPPEAPGAPYGIGQTADGILWFGGFQPSRFDGKTWTRITEPEKLVAAVSQTVYTAPKGDLWMGHRMYGGFHYEGGKWTQYDMRDGLADNQVTNILQTTDGSVWVSTQKGISRFDGRTWTTHALPPDLRGGLRQSRDGAIWINSVQQGKTRTIRYQPDTTPPQTEITVSLDRVSQPGNTVLAWKGASPYKATPDEEIQYSYRMDGGEWSPFSCEKNRVFLSLPSGAHTFEVRARDRDFNVDPTPAAIRFTVVLPVYRQPWFIGLMVVLLGAIGFQTGRVVRRDRRLKEANTALSSANKELFGVNRDLMAANRQIQEATQRKSMFLASMSHELRTPMNAIIGFTNLVLRRSGDVLPERQRENLTKVKLSADHLLSLINDILDLSKVEAGRVDIKAAPFNVKALIESCCATVSPLVRPGVALNHEIADGVGEAHTDEARLRQVIINLLSNALKFTEKGEVKVRVARPLTADRRPPSPIPGPPSSVVGRPSENDFLEIAVSDTGVGIPPEALTYIFDEFRQVEGRHQQQKGTGLGLSITKKLTELLSGTICVESEVGKGSTFTVRVPAVYATVENPGVRIQNPE